MDIYSQIKFAQEIEREWFHSSLIIGRCSGSEDDYRVRYVMALDNKRWELTENIHKLIADLLSSN